VVQWPRQRSAFLSRRYHECRRHAIEFLEHHADQSRSGSHAAG